ncbi:type II secretion system F family protein [Nitratireductor sp. ZSWI3]|uniref:type II secretion system F family protein n=1 Tax=Nitratireductor sp. ZSWI3 TaxID=2966359 RepID=UPI00215020DA|nr:type II secretion system F family protein [Nitratireductor sp. ZSWI3]MCR4264845.1 type II secretion system F family protein [Nitratireductor sp. ZSWI3]
MELSGILANSGILVSTAVFVAAMAMFLFAALVLSPAIQTRRRVSQQLLGEGIPSRRSLAAQTELSRIAARRPVEAYFEAMEKERGEPDALEARLFRAGFHSPSAPALYALSRIALVILAFLGVYLFLSALLPAAIPSFIPLAVAAFLGLGCIVVPSIALDRFEARQKEKYRRGFPDFMDMMVTCADAGMSLEAAVDRVSNELAGTHKALGIQLAIMTLQLRAGKPLREGLRELAERIGIEEARSLAVLFRQSEELGTSLTEALRVYSDEMRSQRILRAEERANVLPVKMVIPLGLCVFPVVLMIVMLPVIIRMRGVFF